MTSVIASLKNKGLRVKRSYFLKASKDTRHGAVGRRRGGLFLTGILRFKEKSRARSLCTGAASVSARRRSPVSAADPTARDVGRRARQEKKDKIIIFFLHIVTGNGGLWQVSEAPKYLGGGVKKRINFPLPPHSHRISFFSYLSSSLTECPGG